MPDVYETICHYLICWKAGDSWGNTYLDRATPIRTYDDLLEVKQTIMQDNRLRFPLVFIAPPYLLGATHLKNGQPYDPPVSKG